MAKWVVGALVDDMDGSEAEEVVSFAIDGQQFEIDRSSAYASEHRNVVAPFVGAARQECAGADRKSCQRANSGLAGKSKEEKAAVRVWARCRTALRSRSGGVCGLRMRVATARLRPSPTPLPLRRPPVSQRSRSDVARRRLPPTVILT